MNIRDALIQAGVLREGQISELTHYRARHDRPVFRQDALGLAIALRRANQSPGATFGGDVEIGALFAERTRLLRRAR